MLLGVLLTLLIIDCVGLTGVILLQRSEGGALGMGGGSNFMSARGTADLLTRTTQILAVIFFVLSLAITILAGRTSDAGSVVDSVDIKRRDPAGLVEPAPTAPPQGLPAPTAPPAGFSVPTPQATDQPLGGGLLAPAPAAPPAGGLTLPPPR